MWSRYDSLVGTRLTARYITILIYQEEIRTCMLSGLNICHVFFIEDNLSKEWPLHAQIYLEDMSWNEGMRSALLLVPSAFLCHCKCFLFFLHLILLCCLIASSDFFIFSSDLAVLFSVII